MMRGFHRKSTPRVKRGRVQKKNNWSESADYYNTPQPVPAVDRKRPGCGYRHLLKRSDIYQFISILPDWAELSRGLNAVVLAPGRHDRYGYYVPGVVHICAWEDDLWEEWPSDFHEEHRSRLDRLGVPCERRGRYVLVKWSESTARADQLMGTFLHELGHHHDEITTRKGGLANRGESYAEIYAERYADRIWQHYLRVFDFRPSV